MRMFSSCYSLHQILVSHVLTLKGERYSQNKTFSSEPRAEDTGTDVHMSLKATKVNPQNYKIGATHSWSYAYKRIFHFE